MDDLLPADPKARRLAIVVWTVGAVVGTVAVWWLSSYVDQLTELSHTDRQAALELFRTRVLPALLVVVFVSAVSGALLLRQGLQIVRTAQFRPADHGLSRPTQQKVGHPTRVIGVVLAVVGFLLAAVPLALLSVMLWMLRNA